ncbi:UNVERIFIED_CONTAM: Retrovirus-related Pol polyprotein from transposon TNT 1-94, partial [Sesamum latifolium]
STRESRVPERYGFVGLTSQLDKDPKTYGEAMSDIDSDKWLEAMKFKMDSMGSNQARGERIYSTTWVDFEETYSPVAMAKSIRILLAIAAWYDYEIWQMDVKTAFLNGFVEEEIFMDQPEGFTTVGEEQKVCRLQRSIYGLKQASRSWNTRFDEVIRGYDFIKNDYDPCVYKKINGSSVAYLVLYVDDILLIGNDVKMLGTLKHDIRHVPGGALERVKSILKYLRRTKDMFLIYGGGELILEGYSDASFQSDDDDAKSQSGFVFKLNGGVVAWKSSKQDTTADSTTEAEYIAASEAAKEAVWMKNYIQELGVVPSIAEPVVIFL